MSEHYGKEEENMIYKIEQEIEKVLMGKKEQIRLILCAWLAGGHILLEDIPGVGKTTLAVAMCKTVGGTYQRVQFTPEILPSDIVGYVSFRPNTGEMIYEEGAVFCNLFLADELNRASGKTQAALLEAMEERQVTVEKKTRQLPKAFCVIATQNPYGAVGTQMLPQSQLDRFMLKLSLGYPDKESQMEILKAKAKGNPMEQIKTVCTVEELAQMQQQIQKIEVHDSVMAYMIELAEKTRKHENVEIGVSPRGVWSLFQMSRAHAFMEQRNYVIPNDVAAVFGAVCGHRIIVKEDGFERKNEDIMEEVLRSVPVPKIKG